MKSILISFVLVSLGFACSEEKKDYNSSIAIERTNYKLYLASDTTLPLNGDTTGINFYLPKKEYKVIAKVEKLKRKDIIHIATSQGDSQKFLKFATLKFNLNNENLSLVLLRSLEGNSNFFLSFSDLTSGEEPYGAGRYLPIEYIEGKDLSIDFNFAFNPKCAYSHDYRCPIPPKENRLKIKIEAGEKTYVK